MIFRDILDKIKSVGTSTVQPQYGIILL